MHTDDQLRPRRSAHLTLIQTREVAPDTSSDSALQPDIFARLVDTAPAAAIAWLAMAGFDRPSGDLIRPLARVMVAGLNLPPPIWALRPTDPVEAEFERLRDEILRIREVHPCAPQAPCPDN